MYFYTCEHDCGLYEGSFVDGNLPEDGAAVYALSCGDVLSPIHTVYAHDGETFEKTHTIILKHEMGEFKLIEITEVESDCPY
jgi:hypothetical protein